MNTYQDCGDVEDVEEACGQEVDVLGEEVADLLLEESLGHEPEPHDVHAGHGEGGDRGGHRPSPHAPDRGPSRGHVIHIGVVVAHDAELLHRLSILQGCLHRFDCVVCVPCIVHWDTLIRDGTYRRLDPQWVWQWSIRQGDARNLYLGSKNWTRLAYIVNGHLKKYWVKEFEEMT